MKDKNFYRKLEKDNNILKYENEKLKQKVFELEKISKNICICENCENESEHIPTILICKTCHNRK